VTHDGARALFPVLKRYAYLNAGTLGPLMRPTATAIEERAEFDLEQGRGGRAWFDSVLDLRARVREKVARTLATEAASVALTSSTTNGCNIVVSGLDLAPADEAVTTDAEHPGLLLPLHASGARVVVAEVAGRPTAEVLDRIASRVTPRTRLLALSHVLWTTGEVMPVQELKRETGVRVLVDGAQSVGAIPVEVGDVDYYTVSGQKWLCGPEPLGALYVRDPEALRIAAPSTWAHQSIEKDGTFVAREGAARFDSGWHASTMLGGWEAALDAAPEWRFARAAEMASRCRAALAERGYDVVGEGRHATLVSFAAPGDAAEIAAKLHANGVVVRDLPGTGWVRVSCGWWTNDDDLERLVTVLAR
jgi:L-cysteine/cystine lyase